MKADSVTGSMVALGMPLYMQGRVILFFSAALSFFTLAAVELRYFFAAVALHAMAMILHRLEGLHPSHTTQDQEHLRRCADAATLGCTTMSVSLVLSSELFEPYTVVVLLSVQGYHWLSSGPNPITQVVEGGEDGVRDLYLGGVGAMLVSRGLLASMRMEWFLEIWGDFFLIFVAGFLYMQIGLHICSLVYGGTRASVWLHLAGFGVHAVASLGHAKPGFLVAAIYAALTAGPCLLTHPLLSTELKGVVWPFVLHCMAWVLEAGASRTWTVLCIWFVAVLAALWRIPKRAKKSNDEALLPPPRLHPVACLTLVGGVATGRPESSHGDGIDRERQCMQREDALKPGREADPDREDDAHAMDSAPYEAPTAGLGPRVQL